MELQFTSQTAKLLNNQMEISEKPLYKPKIADPAPPSIVASSLSLQSSKPPPYAEREESERAFEPGPSSSHADNLTIDVPAVPERMVGSVMSSELRSWIRNT